MDLHHELPPSQQREAITPELLRIVEAIATNPIEFAQRDACMLPVLSLYLLAPFREKRAFPAVVKMFSAPGETAYQLVGDTVTEGLKNILASVLWRQSRTVIRTD